MFSLYNNIMTSSHRRKLTVGDSLLTVFNCGLDTRFADLWSHHSYIIYVVEGRKIWHTVQGSYDLQPGSCVFVRKGASIVEQFFDTRFCLVLFFLPDAFIREVMGSKARPMKTLEPRFDPVIPLHSSANMEIFFQSMAPYFEAGRDPDPALLELKFRELILTLADDPNNATLLSYFSFLTQQPRHQSLEAVMEENFCFNLKLEEYARLSARSLSAFKRDFQQLFHTTPGKWLMEKRLNLAMHLLTTLGKTVSETAFETGFESASHFSRAFRQRYDVSPIAVKRQIAV